MAVRGGSARNLRVNIVGENRGLKRTLGDAERDVEGFTRRVKRIGGAAAKAIGAAVVGAGAAVVGGIGASVRAFADLDDSMGKSLAIMGDISTQMRGKLSDAARDVGKTTSFSASEAADAYFFLASAGLSAEQQLAAMPRVAAFAQAGNFDLARATDLATDAQSALGMATEDAAENLDNLTRVTDVLIKANTLANASAEQFSEALTEKAGAALRSVGKDIEEGAAILGVFADQGVKGTNAGTTLTATLDGLSRNARVNEEAFRNLGVEVFDAEGEMRHMADIVGDLEDGMAGMNTEQREATLAGLGFTKQARAGILALLGQSDAIRDYDTALRDAAGTTDDVASKQLESFKAQLGLLKDRLVDVGISIGERVTPMLQAAVEWLNANGDAIADKVVGGLEGFLGWLDANGPTIQQWFINIRDTAAGVVDAIQTGLGELTGAFADNSEEWEQRSDAAGEAMSAWGRVVKRVRDGVARSLGQSEADVTGWAGVTEQALAGVAEQAIWLNDMLLSLFGVERSPAKKVNRASRKAADEITTRRLLAGAHHSGGIVGQAGIPTRSVGADEVLTLLRPREEVLTTDDPRHRHSGGIAAGGDGGMAALLQELRRHTELLERYLANPRVLQVHTHNPAPERESASVPRALDTARLAAGGRF